jgi:branched-subunit amino acid transport protein
MSETLLVAICGLATYLWRGLGVVMSGRIRTDSAVFTWVGCVAWAMIAGLTMRILLMPSGVLADTAFVALAVFFLLTRRNLFLGVIAAFATMTLLSILRAS